VRTLSEVHRALNAKLGKEDVFRMVTTRVFLRTGVNLKQIRQDQDADQKAIASVITALDGMGYSLR
jgi:hypothetical protein